MAEQDSPISAAKRVNPESRQILLSRGGSWNDEVNITTLQTVWSEMQREMKAKKQKKGKENH